MTTLIAVAGMAFKMLLLERFFPRRNWPARRSWLRRSAGAIAVQAGVAFVGASTWDRALPNAARWHIDDLGLFGGALVGYVVITFVYYWWHRLRHTNELCWRWLHQLHHSPARLELAATFYKHPAEILVNGLLSSTILSLLVGARPEQASIAIVLTGIAELFYHWNVSTPYWLGFLIQRPESHCLHHARERHDCNFSDLPLWDMLFGTFVNPRRDDAICGFEEHEERRVGDMLRGRAVGGRAVRRLR